MGARHGLPALVWIAFGALWGLLLWLLVRTAGG